MGYFAHCLTGASRFPESRADVQYFGDIRQVPEEILRGIDGVVHLCAISNDPMGALYEDVTMTINHRASIDLARKAKHAGVKKFVFASSAACMDLLKAVLGVRKTPSILLRPTRNRK